jgi:hypothetical protein
MCIYAKGEHNASGLRRRLQVALLIQLTAVFRYLHMHDDSRRNTDRVCHVERIASLDVWRVRGLRRLKFGAVSDELQGERP